MARVLLCVLPGRARACVQVAQSILHQLTSTPLLRTLRPLPFSRAVLSSSHAHTHSVTHLTHTLSHTAFSAPLCRLCTSASVCDNWRRVQSEWRKVGICNNATMAQFGGSEKIGIDVQKGSAKSAWRSEQVKYHFIYTTPEILSSVHHAAAGGLLRCLLRSGAKTGSRGLSNMTRADSTRTRGQHR